MKSLKTYILEKIIINQQVDEKLVINKNYKSGDEINKIIHRLFNDSEFKNNIGNETPHRYKRTIINDITDMFLSCITEITHKDAQKYELVIFDIIDMYNTKKFNNALNNIEISGKYFVCSYSCIDEKSIEKVDNLCIALLNDRNNDEIKYQFTEKRKFFNSNIELNFYILENFLVILTSDIDDGSDLALGIYEIDKIE